MWWGHIRLVWLLLFHGSKAEKLRNTKTLHHEGILINKRMQGQNLVILHSSDTVVSLHVDFRLLFGGICSRHHLKAESVALPSMASLQPSSAGHQPNPLMRWTTYPSLLCSLSTTHVDLLERAICASQYGRYVEATEIFHATWPAIHKEPIAALELSEMLKVQTLEHERKQILQEALTSLRIEKRCPKQYFCEVEALTKLLLADATFWVSGNLMASFKAARIFNEWYRERAKSTPNDVEVGRASLGFSIELLTSAAPV